MKRGPFFSLNKTGGFLKSVAHLRGTRLLVEQLARDLGVVRKKTISLTPASNHRVPYHFLEVQSADLLRTFGQRQLSNERSEKRRVGKSVSVRVDTGVRRIN